MGEQLRMTIYMFRAPLWRWHFCIVWTDGVAIVSTKASWGYGKTFARAHKIAQEARYGNS